MNIPDKYDYFRVLERVALLEKEKAKMEKEFKTNSRFEKFMFVVAAMIIPVVAYSGLVEMGFDVDSWLDSLNLFFN